jgi:hypothetical protein
MRRLHLIAAIAFSLLVVAGAHQVKGAKSPAAPDGSFHQWSGRRHGQHAADQ